MSQVTDALLQTIQNLPDDKQQEVLDFADFLRSRESGETSSPQPKVPLPSPNPLIALLEQWRKEDATTDEKTIRAAEAEVAEFKKNMNANRAATGERLLFP